MEISAVITCVNEVRFTIPIAPVTKKNHGRIVMCGKYPKLLPSEAYERYTKAAMPFLKATFHDIGSIDFPVNLKCVFYLDKRRKGDLAGYLQAIQDLLVEAGILADDNRNIVASVDGSEVLYDKTNPCPQIFKAGYMSSTEFCIFATKVKGAKHYWNINVGRMAKRAAMKCVPI